MGNTDSESRVPPGARGDGGAGLRPAGAVAARGAARLADWQQPPATWPSPESEVVSREIRRTIEAALVDLPHTHRVVITLRDMDGYSAEEVCNILQIGAANQRVLLHRARAAVRARIEEYFAAALSTEEARI